MFNLSIIIPTKNRPEKIKLLLEFLKINNFFFDEIIIVDSSDRKKNNLKNTIKIFDFKIKYFTSKSSIALQRNIGLKNLSSNCNYVMFLDDDITFEKNSLRHMQQFILKNKTKYLGYGFNLISKNKVKTFRNNFLNLFNVYSNKPGRITSSGWHSLALNLNKNTLVDWIPSGAAIFNRSSIDKNFFDEFFSDYSYLEDLDFSYSLKKKGKLIIVSNAQYFHFNEIDRSSFFFGEKEIINRAYFVKKHNFSFNLFIFASFLKFFSNLINLKFTRSFGNISGLFKIKNIFKFFNQKINF